MRYIAGGTVTCSKIINSNKFNICINWEGGRHHSKKRLAGGFCYVNDIVLGILELLKKHDKVIYLDMDYHHGNGVEEAFYYTDRVLKISFHHYGEGIYPLTGIFINNTGGLDSIGEGKGKYYNINVPLKENINDDNYYEVFSKVMMKVFEKYKSSVLVLQCGADSLYGDKIGKFNLSIEGI
jgi:histone deacetylase 1/2